MVMSSDWYSRRHVTMVTGVVLIFHDVRGKLFSCNVGNRLSRLTKYSCHTQTQTKMSVNTIIFLYKISTYQDINMFGRYISFCQSAACIIQQMLFVFFMFRSYFGLVLVSFLSINNFYHGFFVGLISNPASTNASLESKILPITAICPSARVATFCMAFFICARQTGKSPFGVTSDSVLKSRSGSRKSCLHVTVAGTL